MKKLFNSHIDGLFSWMHSVLVAILVLSLLAGSPSVAIASAQEDECSVLKAESNAIMAQMLANSQEASRLAQIQSDLIEAIYATDDAPFVKAAKAGEVYDEYMPQIRALNDANAELVEQKIAVDDAWLECKYGNQTPPSEPEQKETDEQRELRTKIVLLDEQIAEVESDIRQIEPERDQLRKQLEMKEMAQCSYADKPCNLTALSNSGWTNATPDQLAELGLSSEDLHPESGAHMQIFYNVESGKYTLAIRGSQGLTDILPFKQWWQDWRKTNVAQGRGKESPQYNDVMAVGQKLATVVGPENFYVTGDSKAGGQAAAVHKLTGAEAITFDAAGLHENTVPRYQRQHGIAPPEYMGTITNIHGTDDPLSNLQEKYPLISRIAPDAIGEQIVITPREGGKIGHNIEELGVYLYERFNEVDTVYKQKLTTREQLQNKKKQLIQQYDAAGPRSYNQIQD